MESVSSPRPSKSEINPDGGRRLGPPPAGQWLRPDLELARHLASRMRSTDRHAPHNRPADALARAVDWRPSSRRPRRGRHPSRAVARKHGLPGTGYPRAWEANSATSMTAVASRRGAAGTRAAEHGAGRGPLWSTPRISGTSAPRPDQPAPSGTIAGRRWPGRGGSTAKVRPDAPGPGLHRHAHRGRQDGPTQPQSPSTTSTGPLPDRTRRWRRPARRRRLDRRKPRQNVSPPTGTSTRHSKRRPTPLPTTATSRSRPHLPRRSRRAARNRRIDGHLCLGPHPESRHAQPCAGLRLLPRRVAQLRRGALAVPGEGIRQADLRGGSGFGAGPRGLPIVSSLSMDGWPGRCRPTVATRPVPGRRGPLAGRFDPENERFGSCPG